MSSPSRSNRFQSFTPLRSTAGSLHRLRTAFSPNRNFLRSASSSSSLKSTNTTSPLTRNSSPHSYRSPPCTDSPIQQLLSVRRKPSVIQFEMEEERQLFGQELGVLEPRPSLGESEVCVVGIFEVLSGKC